MKDKEFVVLVMEKPKDCLHCRKRRVIHDNGKHYQVCDLCEDAYLHQSWFADEDLVDGFISKYCPLRPLPKRKPVHYIDNIFGELVNYTNMGYNDCLDEITGK